MNNFTLDTPMQEVETRYPFAKALLHANFHVGGCASCGYEGHQSIGEVAKMHEKDAEAMVTDLNNGLKQMFESELSPVQVKDIVEKKKVLLIDVREDWERDLVSLEGAIPLSQDTFPKIIEDSKEVDYTVVYCHHGVRSLNATLYLKQNGLENVFSMAGGIEEYAKTVDTNLQRY